MSFADRHVGPNPKEIQSMLAALGLKSLDELVDQTVPKTIRTRKPLTIGAAQSEEDALASLKEILSQNRVFKSYIGMGYNPTHTPAVILRNVMENPGWYTQYTPYQSEIAQGRLEALLNFQTMIMDLTGLEIANASLLDEGTAAAEAMAMCLSLVPLAEGVKPKFYVADDCHPQTLAVVETRAEPLGIEVVRGDLKAMKQFSDGVIGALVQYPSTDGKVHSFKALADAVHAAKGLFVVAADPLALTVLAPPSEFGADIVVGSTQRFGVPMGFGGPHAAYLATRDAYKRQIPGRLVAVSKDADGKPGIRLALQTREQHIRRDKATSNICTAQVLLAVMASMYAVYHGPEGLKRIALTTHRRAQELASLLKAMGYAVDESVPYFDTIRVELGAVSLPKLKRESESRGINLRYLDQSTVTVSMNETTRASDVIELAEVFAAAADCAAPQADALATLPITQGIAAQVARVSPFLTHPVFNSYHSETEMLRYLYRLQSKDLSLAVSMIALGSCTMKLNATTEMLPVTWPEVGNMHPFVPVDQAKGYGQMISSLEALLCEVTGFAAVSLQPNAGSQGEYAGLLAIRAYHRSRGDMGRNVCLIPSSAHGTNPASAAMAGMKVVVVACDKEGNVDIEDLKSKAQAHKQGLSALMVTYPSTHGVFEERIEEICKIVHDCGGQVYMDGANMNAQVGLTRPGDFGPDVCHLNLHKTFCIPHGGGGPGVGPIGVAAHLAPFLPSHPVVRTGGESAIGPVSAAPYGSPSILPIPYLYIKMMGTEGLELATQVAILNANYMAKRLESSYPVLYKGAKGRVAHECILDFRPIKAASGIEVEDVAKRLMDYGYHAPTVSFPVPGTVMIEPTESESKAELDRFCDAMIAIREEIREVEQGKTDKTNNVLKRAPHTAEQVSRDAWDRPYSRERAAYPVASLRQFKFWPAIGRIDNVYGERNLVCACLPIEAYSS